MSAEPQVTTTTGLPTGRWHLLPEASTAVFAVANFGFRTVTGTIPLREGTVDVDAGGVVDGVHVVLDLDGLDTASWRRDADLRRPRLLDVDRHPELAFDATAMTPAGSGWRVDGRLSARGTSTPLAVSVTATEAGREQAGIRATGVLDRRELGVRAPRLLIGHLVRITVDSRWARG
ncbi:Polyisoprenoid-binding protein YceI [Friedmanniella luteola]|uniref:Polyisoprenoid-binding protein YceI n=1 Tax=Friedmanniella luteola TaxID=546871 RepID=A0A1H1Y886_9ACTN|nr:YceI family protein [Friedmanniella luteola]SDT17637.1 Polyisoprenoid-binding protein YceI [Friedmanniella luteola]